MKHPYLITFLLALLSVGNLTAQFDGFGRNKPHYERFEFDVHQSPNFELYSYIEDDNWVRRFLGKAESWTNSFQYVLDDTIYFRNPLIIYANHPDFQQTNAISGSVGTTTGGVTEAFKNRVIMPVAHTNQQTDHVLGHELVHAYQFDMIIRGDSTQLRDLANLPLWMVEGMAEYLSIGAVDPFTSMWMRDAVLNDDVPTLKQLNTGRYFPYRYGQAFWSFVTGLKGDDVIKPYFRATAKYGLEVSTPLVLGMSLEELSTLWVGSLRKTYGPDVGDAKKDRFVGKELVSREQGGGRMNLVPEVSPNGRYLIYLSEQDLFSIDLFLADARTGENIRKIRSKRAGDHLDEMAYIETSGTWSPDSKQFAYVAASKGDNVLVIADVDKGRAERTIRLDDLPAFTAPTWSPNGNSIVVAGLIDGVSDLYQIDLETERITRLTSDLSSETHPSWSADGRKLYFATDRAGIRSYGAARFNLAELDLVSGRVRNLPVFPGADNLNPIEGPDGKLYFLSNRDGFRNIYRYDPGTEQVEQLTNLISGVSGISPLAPAISIDRKAGRLVYTYFSQQGYRIYAALIDRLEAEPVPIDAVDLTAGTLPRLNPQAPLVVEKLINERVPTEVASTLPIQEVAYEPNFKLDYIAGSAGAGVGVNPVFGTNAGAQGGVQAIFSDVLGDNQLYGTALVNGELADLGGTAGYLNRKGRWVWGGSAGRIPFRSFGRLEPRIEEVPIGNDQTIEVGNAPYIIQRLYQNQAQAFAQLPISTTLRFEASLTGNLFTSRVDQYDRFFDPVTGQLLQTGQLRPERRRDLEGESFALANAGVAMVGDDSNFGLTSPIRGYRYRFGANQYVGQFNFTSATADYRRYLWFGKGALAFRFLHQGRYGGNGDELFPLYIGSPWFMRGLVGNNIVDQLDANGRDISQLIGSKLLIGNVELRIPFTGPKQLTLIGSKFLFSDLNFFIDGGAAWTTFDQFDGDQFTLDENGEVLINEATGQPFLARAGVRPIFTAGVSLRVNVFGQIILEPFFARPLIDGGRFRFGLNFQPGW